MCLLVCGANDNLRITIDTIEGQGKTYAEVHMPFIINCIVRGRVDVL